MSTRLPYFRLPYRDRNSPDTVLFPIPLAAAKTSDPAQSVGPFLLPGPTSTAKIERLGRTAITIVVLNLFATANVALAPALPDVIGNYRVFASYNDTGSGNPGAVAAALTSTSNLQITIKRAATTTQAVSPGNTDDDSVPASGGTVYPSDTQVDVGLGHSHLQDGSGFGVHAHKITGTHQHNLVGGIQITLNVDWMIVHI